MSNMDKITIGELREIVAHVSTLKTVAQYKEYVRSIRDKYNLTDMEALDLANNRIINR